MGQEGREPVAGISNFVKLPGNDYNALMNAVGTVGPVSISVDASWGAYEKGVYKGCSNKTTTIDHVSHITTQYVHLSVLSYVGNGAQHVRCFHKTCVWDCRPSRRLDTALKTVRIIGW